MGAKLPWVKRAFDFSYPVEIHADLIERVRGTPARAEDWVRQIRRSVQRRECPPDALTRRDGETWSIQENLGHLLDLEELMHGRLDDFLAGAEVLRAADMSNQKTHQANHNTRSIDAVLEEFRETREQLVARAERLSDADFARTALHPRLKQPMRVVDWLMFTACHDDYHLARVSELFRLFSGRRAP